MAGVIHAFVSSKTEGSDATKVRTSKWNAEHEISGASLGDILYAGATGTTGRVIAGLASAAGVPYWSGAGVAPVMTVAPTLTGTNFTGIPFAALSDAANIARLDQVETVAGAWTFSTAPTLAGTNITAIPETAIADGALLARVASVETISGAWTFSTAPTLAGTNITGLPASAMASGELAVARGGTGLGSYAIGDLLYASGATTLAKLADVATGSVLVSGGVGVAPAWSTAPTILATNITGLNATQLTTGTVPDARFPATLPALSGVNLTALNATQLTSGTVPDARIAATGVTQHQASLTILETQITDGSLLARVAGAETITGAWVFSPSTNILEQRNGVNAQIFRVYNTYTDGLNNESGAIEWSSNLLQFRARANGTGTLRTVGIVGNAVNLYFGAATTLGWQVSTTGHLVTGADNTYDIGAALATRPRNIHVAGSIAIGNTVAGGAIAIPNAVAIQARNAANTANLSLLSLDASDNVNLSPSGRSVLLFGHLLGGVDNTYDIGASGATRPRSVYVGSSVLVSGTGGIGYTTGAGGTVTQITSKATGVTINKTTGQITMNGAALAAGAKVSFVVTDSALVSPDGVNVWVASGGTANAYRADVTAIATGSFTVTVENITAGALSEAPVVGFALIKSATS